MFRHREMLGCGGVMFVWGGMLGYGVEMLEHKQRLGMGNCL